MALFELSAVTDTLLNVLQTRIDRLRLQLLFTDPTPNPPPPPFQVVYSRLPSDKLSGDLTLGLYLYHVMEEPYLKNQPPNAADAPPVRFTPMGLQLYYQLTVHTEQTDKDNGMGEAYMQRVQSVFGLALKTLHDYPRLDKDTMVDDGTASGKLAFSPDLQNSDNVLRITLLPVTRDQAEQFWSSSTQPVRLSAYYLVNAVLLEPEVPKHYAGRVLQYGVQTFVNGAPRLVASHNIITYRLPDDPPASKDRKVTVHPAEIAVGDTVGDEADRRIVFDGTDLLGDTPTILLVKLAGWDRPATLGADWSVAVSADFISAKVGTLVTLMDPLPPLQPPGTPPAGQRIVVPGIYSAQVQVTRNRLMPDGTTRVFVQTSNEVPFTIAPTVTASLPANVDPTNRRVILAEAPGLYSLSIEYGNLSDQALQVIVAGITVPPTQNPVIAIPPPVGQYKLADPPWLNRIQVSLQAPAGVTYLPLRVIVNGAECAPLWVKF